MAHDELKSEVIEACRELTRLGLVAGTSGNVSVRVPDSDLVVVSPSSVAYSRMTIDDVCVVDARTSDVVDGFRNPSTELLMHRAVFGARPDVRAVVHAHAMMVTALTLVGRSIPPITHEQVAILGGDVLLCRDELPGSQALADAVVEALGDRRAVMLPHHGMLAAGRSLDEALTVAQMTERLAGILLAALAHGEVPCISDEARDLERMTYEMKLRAAEQMAAR